MSTLEQFKTHLAQQYDAVLGVRLVESTSGDARQPIWLENKNQAWLLDREIGLALRIVPYDDANENLNEAIQGALKITTLLQPRHGLRVEEADTNGIWQVGIIWLVVKSTLGETWRTSIAAIRKESGFSEEIGLDAILANGEKDFGAACLRHGVPQLLLHLRRLIGLSLPQIPAWLSANTRVEEMLGSFSDRFAGDLEARQLASTLVTDALNSYKGETSNSERRDTKNPRLEALEEIEIKSFRNITSCHLRFPKDKGRQAQAHIVFGPNGTGKTSIFEAICLGAGGTSRTWERYQIDGDIESRVRNYPTSVLAPLQSNESPEVVLNGVNVPLRLTESARVNWRDLDGNLLGQEESREFLGELGANLAERILKGYSTLADRVTEFASSRERIAKDEKSAWLREHGLNASITRRETRAHRLIEAEIQKQSWVPSQTVLDWLDKTPLVIPGLEDDGRRLAVRWRAWKDQQVSVVEGMTAGVLIGETSLIQPPLLDWLRARNALIQETNTLVTRASASIDSLRSRLIGIDRELDAWGEWIARQSTKGTSATLGEQQDVMLHIERARNNLADIRQRIAVERRHAAHLTQIKVEFLSMWSQRNPNICPTCGKDNSASGGIEKAVAEVQRATEDRLADWEGEEKKMVESLNALEAQLSSLGLSPITQGRQKDLQELLKPFAGDRSLQSLLMDASERSALKSSIRSTQVLPDVPMSLSEEALREITQKLAERSMSLDTEAERLWPLPERWGKIVKALREECDQIVARHLPETVQKVWWEIAAALTAARWNLASRPVFQVRGQGRLIVGVEQRPDTPARYLFNQAEQHIMGLAWFVVRYLTHGRFHRALIVLDDPAQEMDQTTFRSFARFAQALLRIHETRRMSLQMVLFLHQEDRALDLARATMGRFVMLTWQRTIQTSDQDKISEVRLISEGFLPQSALALLTERASAS